MSCSHCVMGASCPQNGSNVLLRIRRATQVPSAPHTVALVGNPNVGKSTLFNALTGSCQTIINAPGTTVEMFRGFAPGMNSTIIDLPGTYSLLADSPDEQVVTDALASAEERPDLALVLLDATALPRCLYLLEQVRMCGSPVFAVLTMADIAAQNGAPVDAAALADILQVPVAVVDPRRRRGLVELQQRVVEALHPTGLGEEATQGMADGAHGQAGNIDGAGSIDGVGEENGQSAACGCGSSTRGSHAVDYERIAESETIFAWVDNVMQQLHERAVASAPDTGLDAGQPAQQANAQTSAPASDKAARAAAGANPATKLTRSDQIDRVLLHPLVGTVLFFGIMWLLFQTVAVWAGPIMDFFDSLFTNTEAGAWSFANLMILLVDAAGGGGSWVENFLVGGLSTGLGVVASFFPLMLLIFIAISLLEDSGYMARAAFLGDYLMRAIGLDGRVILPLIVGYGCNLPALGATRTLPNARQRLVAILIIPYTSCAARLAIYLMIARVFFPNWAGTVVWGMYLLSMLLIVLGAWILKPISTGRGKVPGEGAGLLPRRKPASTHAAAVHPGPATAVGQMKENRHHTRLPLLLALPSYQVPRVVVLARSAWKRSWAFVTGAGKIIVAMTLVVWLLSAIPVRGDHEFGQDVPMSDSAYGATARVLEPLFVPAGFGDWHMTGALMTGFVAKETVISSIVTSYNLDPETDGGDAEDGGTDLGKLPELVEETFQDTAGDSAPVAALAFLVFVLAYTPCMATVAEQRRMIGTRWTVGAVVVQLLAAWLLAVLVFQVGRLFF